MRTVGHDSAIRPIRMNACLGLQESPTFSTGNGIPRIAMSARGTSQANLAFATTTGGWILGRRGIEDVAGFESQGGLRCCWFHGLHLAPSFLRNARLLLPRLDFGSFVLRCLACGSSFFVLARAFEAPLLGFLNPFQLCVHPQILILLPCLLLRRLFGLHPTRRLDPLTCQNLFALGVLLSFFLGALLFRRQSLPPHFLTLQGTRQAKFSARLVCFLPLPASKFATLQPCKSLWCRSGR